MKRIRTHIKRLHPRTRIGIKAYKEYIEACKEVGVRPVGYDTFYTNVFIKEYKEFVYSKPAIYRIFAIFADRISFLSER